jgi:predicted RNase H-like HicB family nuclease
MKLTAIIIKNERRYIGIIKQVPEVITQGETIKKTKENLLDALEIFLNSEKNQRINEDFITLEEDLLIEDALKKK